MAIKKLGFGLMRLPYSEDKTYGNVDLEQTKAMIDAYMAEGFTYFDTAAVYHGGRSIWRTCCKALSTRKIPGYFKNACLEFEI